MTDNPNDEHVFEATLADGPDSAATPFGQKTPNQKTPNQKLLQSKMMVLAILFFVTGFLGIPLLWKSPKFSPNERIIWSVIVTVYTLALIYGAFAICMWSYRQITGSY